MKGGTLQSIQKTGGLKGAIRMVEAQVPGFRVIAGPFYVESPTLRADEIRYARAAVKLQADAGCPHELVKYRGMAFVLRSVEGWKVDVAGSGEYLERYRTQASLRNGLTGRGKE